MGGPVEFKNYFFETGNNSGMTHRQLHDDVWDFQFDFGSGALIYGGSYKSNGNDAGIYSIKGRPLTEAISNDENSFPTFDPEDIKDKGGRCVHRLPESFYIEKLP